MTAKHPLSLVLLSTALVSKVTLAAEAPVPAPTPPSEEQRDVSSPPSSEAPEGAVSEGSDVSAAAPAPPPPVGAGDTPVSDPASPELTAETATSTPSTGAEAEAAPPAEENPDVYPFPQGETQKMSDHGVNLSKARFRPGKGLSFESEDGDFSMSIKIRGQLLYAWEKAEETEGEYADAVESLTIRRARLALAGNFWGRNNKYKVELAVSPRDMGVRDSLVSGAPNTSPLLDFYFDFTHLRDLSLRVGQYKVPFNRQRVVSSGSLQMVDRSSVNGEFNVDRDIGFDFRSEDFLGLDLIKYYAGAYIGEGRNSATEDDFGLMYLARVELLPFGTDFEDYIEGALERPASPKMSIGLGYGHLDNARHDQGILGRIPADGGTTDMNLLNADVLFKYSGFSFFTEGVLRDGTRTAGDAVVVNADGEEVAISEAAPRSGYGAMVQTGYLFPETNFELAARAGLIRPLNDDSALQELDELGLGTNYYFAHHSFKLQADYFMYRLGEEKLLEHQVRVQLEAGF